MCRDIVACVLLRFVCIMLVFALPRFQQGALDGALTFMLENQANMPALVALAAAPSRAAGSQPRSPRSDLVRQLRDMGFPERWAARALSATDGSYEHGLTYILANQDLLRQQDGNFNHAHHLLCSPCLRPAHTMLTVWSCRG